MRIETAAAPHHVQEHPFLLNHVACTALGQHWINCGPGVVILHLDTIAILLDFGVLDLDYLISGG